MHPTNRQRQIIELRARGMKYTEIASFLGVHYPTLRNHVAQLRRKYSIKATWRNDLHTMRALWKQINLDPMFQ